MNKFSYFKIHRWFYCHCLLVIWVSQRFGDKKIGFNSCEYIKFLNIANIHTLDVWGNRIFHLQYSNKMFFLCFFSVYSFCNATSFHSSYVIKPLQPSSAIYGAPPFTGHLISFINSTHCCTLSYLTKPTCNCIAMLVYKPKQKSKQ